MSGWVYFITNRINGTLYTGVTNNLARRTFEHRNGSVEGFTKRYDLKRLVWFEEHDSVPAAILREKQIKEWKRAWKIRLIEEMNPEWDDLWELINR